MANNNSAQLQRYLRLLPEFNGLDTRACKRFIRLCDKIIQNYVTPNADDDLLNSLVLNSIRSKLTAAAAECVAIANPTNWEDMRKLLYDKFADHRDEAALCASLCARMQGPKNLHAFYGEIQRTFNTIMTLVAETDELPTTIEAKKKLYEKLALQTFLCGLNEPVGSRVRCMRPKTCDIAFQYALKEEHSMHLQHLMIAKNNGAAVTYTLALRNNNINAFGAVGNIRVVDPSTGMVLPSNAPPPLVFNNQCPRNN